MRFRAVVLVVCLLATAVPARAADAPKPLRTLTYDVSYSFASIREQHVSGLTGGGNSDNREPDIGRGATTRGIRSEDQGTLTIDVIAATPDGGLVVDASYDGRQSKQPPLRVAIYQDGQLAYDPKLQLSAQALHLLPLLARGILAGRALDEGTAWSTPLKAPAEGAVQYRIVKRETATATLAIASDLKLGGVGGFDEHDDGTAVYATDRLCPVSYDLRFRIRRTESAGENTSTDGRVLAKLTADSFAKR